MDKLATVNNVTTSNSNNSSISPEQFDEHDSSSHEHLDLKVVMPALLGVLCVLGLACNLTALGILLSNARKSRLSLINSLVLNLMLADGLVLAFAVPLRAAAYSSGDGWTLGWSVCKTSDWFLQSCMAAKSFTVAVMAKACYRYVSNPTKQVSVRPASVLFALLVVWLAACSAPVPHWLFAELRSADGGVLACVQAVPPEARDFMSVYAKAYPLGVFCAPLSFALAYFWKAYGRCQRRSSKTQNLRTQIRSRKLTLTVFGLTVAMAALWLPQWVVWVWERHAAARRESSDGGGGVGGGGGGGGEPAGAVSSPPPLLSVTAQLLALSLSLVNPLVVLSLSEEFREGYRGLWRRLTLRKQHPPPKPKPGPHAATAPQSPCPRPETSGQPRGGDRDRGPSSRRGHRGSTHPQAEQQGGGDEEKGGGDSPREGIVLPDVEQFWHERETGSFTEENDPIPWEHNHGAREARREEK